MVTVTKISVKDFLSHAESEISLGDEPLLVFGETGSGKSTFVEALVVGLGGSPRDQLSLSDYVRTGESGEKVPGFRVAVEFESNGERYVSEVSKGSGSRDNRKISLRDSSGNVWESDSAVEKLAELVPSPEALVHANVLRQGEHNLFQSLRKGDRRDLVASFLPSFEKAAELAKADLKAVNERLDSMRSELSSIGETSVTDEAPLSEKADALAKELEDAATGDAARKKKAELERELSGLDAAAGEFPNPRARDEILSEISEKKKVSELRSKFEAAVRDAESAVPQAPKRGFEDETAAVAAVKKYGRDAMDGIMVLMDEIREERSAFDAKKAELDAAVHVPAKPSKDEESVSASIRYAETELVGIRKTKSSLEALVGCDCPTCRRPVDEKSSASVMKAVSDMESAKLAEIKGLSEKLAGLAKFRLESDAKAEKELATKKEGLEKELATMKDSYDAKVVEYKGRALAGEKAKFDSAMESREKGLANVAKAKKELEAVPSAEKIRASLETLSLELAASSAKERVEAVRKELGGVGEIKTRPSYEVSADYRVASEELARAKASNEASKRSEERRKFLETEIADLSAEASVLAKVSSGFSKDFVTAMLVEASESVEDEANRLLAKFSAGRFSCKFKFEADKKDGSGTKEAFDLAIFDRGTERKYGNLSGGERLWIDWAQHVSFVKTLCGRYGGAALGNLVIDEGFGTQGEEALSHVLPAVAELSKEFSLLVISHHPGVTGAFPNAVEVVKEGGVSHVSKS